MEKYTIAHYNYSKSVLFGNGGKFIVTENEYIVKYLFKTVAKFEINKTLVSKATDNLLIYNGLCLNDGNKSINLNFFRGLPPNYISYSN